MSAKTGLGVVQAEILYNAAMQTLKAYNLPIEDKYLHLWDELSNRHDATDVLDVVESLYTFICAESDVDVEEEEGDEDE